jgi:hypothetical protein
VATAIETQGFIQPSVDFLYLYAQDPGVFNTATADFNLISDSLRHSNIRRGSSCSTQSTSAQHRVHKKYNKTNDRVQKSSLPSSRRGSSTTTMQESDDRSATGTAEPSAPAPKKSKRVRTGCLTCRERHLKCDEGLPNCQNCCKSNRVCKRGVRLNFIDTQVQAPPVVPRSNDWSVNFMDESRDIASEYKGGLSRYGVQETDNGLNGLHNAMAYDFTTSTQSAALPALQSLPSIQGMLPDTFTDDHGYAYEAPREPQHHHTHSLTETSYSGSNMQHTPATAYSNPDRQPSPNEETRDYLATQEEVLFMQVFVEEVGLWMDSMDPQKHVCQEPSIKRTFCVGTDAKICSFRDCCRFTPLASQCCSMRSSPAVPGTWPS